MLDFASNIDDLYRARCALDEAIVSAYVNGRMYVDRIARIVDYTPQRVREIINAATRGEASASLELVRWYEAADRPTGPGRATDAPTGDTEPSEGMSGASPLAMPRSKRRYRPRRPANRGKAEIYTERNS